MLRMTSVVLAALTACSALACNRAMPESAAPPARTSDAASQAQTPASTETASRPRIVFLGDSLTAGLGLPADDAYPALIQQRLKQEGLEYEVVNAGVSGDTSAGGLSRFDWSMQGDVRILIVALGGNDGLRGLPVEQLSKNLSEIVERAQQRHVQVIMAGMEAPPNYGRDYIVSFHKVYPAIAQRYHIAIVPFLLQNVAGIPSLNQADGIHPTADGARIVADNVWTVLEPLAARTEGRRTGS